MTKKLILGCLSAASCELLFGLSFLFTKTATQSASALELLAWRFVIAFGLLTVILAVGHKRPHYEGKDLKPLIIIALLNPILYFICETVGIQLTTASEGAAFLACIPVAALILSSLMLKEWPSSKEVIGVCLTMLGILISVFVAGVSSSFSLQGYLILSLAVIGYALYCVYVEKAKDYTSLDITYAMLLSGAIGFSLLAIQQSLAQGQFLRLITLPLTHVSFTIAALYQAIGCSIIGYLLSNYAIASIGVNRTASFIGLSTIISIIAAILILGEPFSYLQILSGLLVILGVYVANLA